MLNTRLRMETKILEDTVEIVSPSSHGPSFWIGIMLLITAGVLGASGIVLYNNAQNKIIAKKNATRVTVEVTPTTAPVSLTTQYENPFEEKTQYENPFSQEQNQSENPFNALTE